MHPLGCLGEAFEICRLCVCLVDGGLCGLIRGLPESLQLRGQQILPHVDTACERTSQSKGR